MDVTASPLDQRTLRERTTAQVRRLVISGALRPGDHIVETRLSKQLDVSRGTLRESLRALEVEGLLVGDGRGHLSVRAMSPRQVLEVYDVRAALEVLAATKLAGRSDRRLIVAELRQVLEPLKDRELAFARQIEVDLGFHARMCALTDNDALVESWQRLVGRLQMVIVAAGPLRATDRMRFEEHDVIVSAIESGDAAHAGDVVRGHLDAFCGLYVRDAMAREAGEG